MVDYVVAYLKTATTEKGRLQSEIELMGWNLKTGEHHEGTLYRPHHTPTTWLPSKPDPLQPYKEALRAEYRHKLQRADPEMEELITGFLADMDNQVRIEEAFPSRNSSVYHLVAPFLNKELQKPFIPRDFLVDSPHNSYQRQAELALGFPFFTITKKGVGGRVSLEELACQKGLAIDFETHNWERLYLKDELENLSDGELYQKMAAMAERYEEGLEYIEWMDRGDYIRKMEEIQNKHRDERITTASLISLDHGFNYLITTLDAGCEGIRAQSPLDDSYHDVAIVRVSDQKELITVMNELIAEFNPLFLYGHNQMTFDYRKAQELVGNLGIGVSGRAPERRAGIGGGFIEQRINPGRIDIDPAQYSRKAMWNYNNKLDTVFLHLFGKYKEKTLTHAQITEMTQKGEDGEHESARILLEYAAEDSMKSYLIGEDLKREHLALSYLYSSLPARIDSTGNKTLCSDYWMNQRMKRVKTYPHPLKEERLRVTSKLKDMGMRQVKFDDFDGRDFFTSVLKKHTSLDMKAKRGIHTVSLFHPMPYLSAFKDLIKQPLHEYYMKDTLDLLLSTDDKKQKIRMSRFLESVLEYPLFRAIGCEDDRDERAYSAFFERGFKGNAARDDKNRVWHNISRIATALSDTRVINHNKVFLVLAKQDGLDKTLEGLEDQLLGVYLGDGLCASGKRGRFSVQIGPELIMQGIADPSSNRGERCELEKDLYRQAFGVLCDTSVSTFLQYCNDLIKEFYSSKADAYSFSRIAKRHFYEYSLNATQRYTSKMSEHGVQKDDHFTYTYTHEELQEKFFGRTGTIRELLRFIFPPLQATRRDASLEKLLAGRAGAKDMEQILRNSSDTQVRLPLRY
ncbi:MAG: hypothetical protein ACQESG_00565 [Nanobdellota archaeon]